MKVRLIAIIYTTKITGHFGRLYYMKVSYEDIYNDTLVSPLGLRDLRKKEATG